MKLKATATSLTTITIEEGEIPQGFIGKDILVEIFPFENQVVEKIMKIQSLEESVVSSLMESVSSVSVDSALGKKIQQLRYA